MIDKGKDADQGSVLMSDEDDIHGDGKDGVEDLLEKTMTAKEMAHYEMLQAHEDMGSLEKTLTAKEMVSYELQRQRELEKYRRMVEHDTKLTVNLEMKRHKIKEECERDMSLAQQRAEENRSSLLRKWQNDQQNYLNWLHQNKQGIERGRKLREMTREQLQAREREEQQAREEAEEGRQQTLKSLANKQHQAECNIDRRQKQLRRKLNQKDEILKEQQSKAEERRQKAEEERLRRVQAQREKERQRKERQRQRRKMAFRRLEETKKSMSDKEAELKRQADSRNKQNQAEKAAKQEEMDRREQKRKDARRKMANEFKRQCMLQAEMMEIREKRMEEHEERQRQEVAEKRNQHERAQAQAWDNNLSLAKAKARKDHAYMKKMQHRTQEIANVKELKRQMMDSTADLQAQARKERRAFDRRVHSRIPRLIRTTSSPDDIFSNCISDLERSQLRMSVSTPIISIGTDHTCAQASNQRRRSSSSRPIRKKRSPADNRPRTAITCPQ